MRSGVAKAVALGVWDWAGKSNLLWQVGPRVLAGWLPHHRRLGMERRPRFIFAPTPLRPIPRLHNTTVEAKIERHDAVRAGSHLDFRMKMPDGTIQDFVVTRRTQFPDKTGRAFNIVRSPHHSRRYFYEDRAEFPEGAYGHGKMKTVWRGRLDVHESNRQKMEFTISEGEFKGRYCIRNVGSRNEPRWILLRMKQQDPAPYWTERMKYANTEPARRNAYASGDYIAEVKENGAHYYVIPGPKENMVLSRRMSVDGRPIDRAANIPQLKYHKFPEKYHGKRIHVEVVAHEGSPSHAAGLLNASPALSRSNQARLGKPLRAVVFDIEGPGTYEERRSRDMRAVCKNSPRVDLRTQGHNSHRFLSVRLAQPKLLQVVRSNGRADPEAFTEKVKARGEEGTVLKHRQARYYDEERPHVKDKRVDTVDLRVVGFQEGTGKHSGRLGALVCQDPETGAYTKVGTGYSDYERQWIWDHQDEVDGQLIEVDHNWKIHTGSYHGPRYRGFHPESGVSINDEQGLLDYADAASEPGKAEETKYRLISSAGWRR